MSELLEKIRSRGHWRVVIRPATFDEKRVADSSALYPILQKTSVQRRGWSFPIMDFAGPPVQGKDWIGQEIDHAPILELWRFYQSGQFVCYSDIQEDWLDNPHSLLPEEASQGGCRVSWSIEDVIARYTMIFEFAARLAFTGAGDAGMHLEVAVKNLKGYYLTVNSESPGVSLFKPADIVELPYKVDLPKTELVAQTRDLALKPAIELFSRFRWNPGIEMLRDIQAELAL